MADAKRFEGMTAVVTGGASGIGLGVAKRIAAEGGRVTIWDMDPARLKAAVAEVGAKSARADEVNVDRSERGRARDPRQPPARWATSTCSSARPALRARTRMVIDYPIDEWKRVFDINVQRPLLLQSLCREAHEGARLRPHRQHRLDRRQGGQSDGLGLQRVKGRGHRPHQVARQGTRQGRRHRQCDHAGDDRHADPRAGVGRAYRLYALENSDGSLRHGRRSRRARLLAREPRMLVHDRRGLRSLGRPRDLLRLSGVGARARSCVHRDRRSDRASAPHGPPESRENPLASRL